MIRLKERNRQIPNGLKFVQAETGFQPIAWSSFDSICRQVLTHRQGNPWLVQKHGWAMTMEGIASEIDFYNSKLCQVHNWPDFIIEDSAAPPDFQSPSLNRPSEGNVAGGSKVKKAVSGLKLLTDWLGSGLKPVERTLAQARAKVCLKCPQNQLGDFWQRMEGLAADEIRTLIEVKKDLDLSIPGEEKLHSCLACDCFMPLKVWVPLVEIKAHTSPEVMAALDKKCWIPKEQ
jgi:hypothetical protein